MEAVLVVLSILHGAITAIVTHEMPNPPVCSAVADELQKHQLPKGEQIVARCFYRMVTATGSTDNDTNAPSKSQPRSKKSVATP